MKKVFGRVLEYCEICTDIPSKSGIVCGLPQEVGTIRVNLKVVDIQYIRASQELMELAQRLRRSGGAGAQARAQGVQVPSAYIDPKVGT